MFHGASKGIVKFLIPTFNHFGINSDTIEQAIEEQVQNLGTKDMMPLHNRNGNLMKQMQYKESTCRN